MQYSFDDQEAFDYGVYEAIMIWNMRFWILKNKANNRHQYRGEDGIVRTWTYNSTEAFCKLFIFWSSDQIDRLIKKMIEKKIILTGNFNQNSYNRTRWFAFFDENKMLSSKLVIAHFADSRNGSRDSAESNSRNYENDSAEVRIGNSESAESNTDNKPNIKPSIDGNLHPYERKLTNNLRRKSFSSKKDFEKPTYQELFDYFLELDSGVNPQDFIDHYDSVGWVVGKNIPMKDWKAAARKWNNREWTKHDFPGTRKKTAANSNISTNAAGKISSLIASIEGCFEFKNFPEKYNIKDFIGNVEVKGNDFCLKNPLPEKYNQICQKFNLKN